MLPPPDLICCCAFCNASGGMSLASSSLRPTFSCCTVVLFSFVSVELEGPRAQRHGVGGKDFRKSGASKMWRVDSIPGCGEKRNYGIGEGLVESPRPCARHAMVQIASLKICSASLLSPGRGMRGRRGSDRGSWGRSPGREGALRAPQKHRGTFGPRRCARRARVRCRGGVPARPPSRGSGRSFPPVPRWKGGASARKVCRSEEHTSELQ